MTGLIVKAIAGFYYVKSGGRTWSCKARGLFKKDGTRPCVGDEVRFAALDDEDGFISEILPRKNAFIRPPIANVDCFAVVVAAAEPAPNLPVLDKFLVTAEQAGAEAIICINKTDLDKNGKTAEIVRTYRGIYEVLPISCKLTEGLSGLTSLLAGRKTAFAGPSGVGKSTIISRLQADFEVQTGVVSEKTKRGKHTTRHVEIFELAGGGLVYDTPGFTSFDVPSFDAEDLAEYYPEFAPYLGKCRFDNCRHLQEPGCAVREALERGEIARTRYGSYVEQYAELEQRIKY